MTVLDILLFWRVGPFIPWPSPFHSPIWHITHARSLYSCPALATPWTVASQASLSIGFSRQEHWSGLPCPLPGYLPNPGIDPTSLISPAFTTSATWEAGQCLFPSWRYPILGFATQKGNLNDKKNLRGRLTYEKRCKYIQILCIKGRRLRRGRSKIYKTAIWIQ